MFGLIVTHTAALKTLRPISTTIGLARGLLPVGTIWTHCWLLAQPVNIERPVENGYPSVGLPIDSPHSAAADKPSLISGMTQTAV